MWYRKENRDSYETPEREAYTKILDRMWYRKENRDSYVTPEREAYTKILDRMWYGTGRKIDILYETFERED